MIEKKNKKHNGIVWVKYKGYYGFKNDKPLNIQSMLDWGKYREYPEQNISIYDFEDGYMYSDCSKLNIMTPDERCIGKQIIKKFKNYDNYKIDEELFKI